MGLEKTIAAITGKEVPAVRREISWTKLPQGGSGVGRGPLRT